MLALAKLVKMREIDQNIPLESLSPRQRLERVRETGEKRTISHDVLLNEIHMDPNVIVDKTHAKELADVILHGVWKQTAPFLLRARLVNGKSVNYDIADAMHRISGLKEELGHNSDFIVEAAVMYGCSDAELIEHRILAANSVESVRFARLGRWFNMAWQQTPWADRLSAKTAFGITHGDSSGKKSDLTSEDVIRIKNWVLTNASVWRTGVENAYKILKIHEAADPGNVYELRLPRRRSLWL